MPMTRSLPILSCALLVMTACNAGPGGTNASVAALEAQIAELEGVIADKLPSLEVKIGQLEAARQDEGLYAWDSAGEMLGRVLAHDTWSLTMLVPGVEHPVIALFDERYDDRIDGLGIAYTETGCKGDVYGWALGATQTADGTRLMAPTSIQKAFITGGVLWDWRPNTEASTTIASDRQYPWSACRDLTEPWPFEPVDLPYVWAPTDVGPFAAGIKLGRLP